MDIRQVGVLGCGQMGSGIAQVAAAAGFSTVVLETSQELCERGRGGILQRLGRMVDKGSIDAAQRTSIEGRLSFTTDPARLADSDLVVEAIVENLEEKSRLWRALDPILKREAILASNTSSVSITEMMVSTSRPDRFLGIHFMNPVPVMELVEVIATIATSREVVEQSMEFVRKLGKKPVQTTDRPGFIVNRLLIPYLLDAIRGFEEGIGSIADIDLAMRLGCGHPMGPFTLLDFIGLDTVLYIANILSEEFREPRFAPPGLLKRMVIAGWLGRKSGKGFYDYSDPGAPSVIDELRRRNADNEEAMPYENLLIDRRERVAIVTINRPAVLNAMNRQTLREMDDCFRELQDDADAGAVIITGAGEKAFIAGADINELAVLSPREAMECALRGQALFNAIENLGKPTIAAINGFALGGGCELALACSLRIASSNARIGLPEVKLGIVPGYGGSQRLPRLIGKGLALAAILTGEPIGAEEAYRCGLFNQVVAPDQLLPTSEALARKIAANAPLAVRGALQAVNRGLNMPLEEALEFEAALFGVSFSTDDMREGTKAFLEKRAAKFRGR